MHQIRVKPAKATAIVCRDAAKLPVIVEIMKNIRYELL